MNIYKIAMFTLAFILSLSALASENHEAPIVETYNEITSGTKAAFTQENQPLPLLVAATADKQATSETRDVGLFTKLCINLSIVMVYWFYWLKNSTT